MKNIFLSLLIALAISTCAINPALASGGSPSPDVSGKTANRLILTHGLLGFDKALAEYFYKIKAPLESIGADIALSPSLGSTGSNSELADVWIAKVTAIRVGNEKFNCIGHSQGGLVCRSVQAKRPDLIASITTIGTPHFGSFAADEFEENATFALGFAQVVGEFMNAVSGTTDGAEDAVNAMNALTSAGAFTFNQDHPNGLPSGYCKKDGAGSVNGTGYYSVASYYDHSIFNGHINVLDPSTHLFFFTSFLTPEKHDGLVTQCSQYFGTVIADNLIMQHDDQINGILGARGSATDDPIEMYKTIARRLKDDGY